MESLRGLYFLFRNFGYFRQTESHPGLRTPPPYSTTTAGEGPEITNRAADKASGAGRRKITPENQFYYAEAGDCACL